MKIRATVEIPDRSISRAKLEYPVENVEFVYLLAIGKAMYGHRVWLGTPGVATTDIFTDKAVQSPIRDGGSLGGRTMLNDTNAYRAGITVARSASDYYIERLLAGSSSFLAMEAVDLSDIFYICIFSVAGSTLKAFRENIATPRITATDTNIASGYFGIGVWDGATRPALAMITAILIPPATPLPPALAVLEVEVEGSGAPEDPYRPLLDKNLVEIAQLEGLPSFLYQEAKKYEILKSKGFTEEEMRILLGYIPQHQVDLQAITYGAFEFSEESPTNIIIISGDNPYRSGAISKQVELAKSKNLKTLRPPRNYGEAVAQYNQIKRDYTHWLAGKDNYAYQTLGLEELDLLQNVDFYHGELIEHKTHYQQLKQVPEAELWRRLEVLEEKLSKVTVLTEERDRHISKLKEVKRLGW